MQSAVPLRMGRFRIAPRFFAILLLLLIVSPFTAPFASIDFASLMGENAAPSGVFDAKTMKEESTAGFMASTAIDLTFLALVCTETIAFFADIRPLPLSVLRV